MAKAAERRERTGDDCAADVRPLRVAFLVGAFPVITETFILNQITGLIDRGHRVDIFAKRGRGYTSLHADIEKYRLVEATQYVGAGQSFSARVWAVLGVLFANPKWFTPRGFALAQRIVKGRKSGAGLKTVGLFRFASRELSAGPYDIIHCQFGNLGHWLAPALSTGAIHGRLITSFRGHDITQQTKLGAGYYDVLFREGTLFLPVSCDLQRRLVQQGCPAAKIAVLHSGIDSARLRFRERRRAADEPTRIITIARFVEMKGVTLGIDAIARLVRQGRNVRYDIVGDGPQHESIKALIASHHLETVVQLHGWLAHEQVLDLLNEAHLLLAPSVTAANGETEGIPNAVKEAMAMGLPVVSTLHSGIPELVDDGVSGLLAPERDVAALARCLAALCDHPERWPVMGRAGRVKIEAEFDRENLNDRLVALYRAALNPTPFPSRAI